MKKIVRVVLILLIFVLVVEPAWATTISDLQQEQEELKKKQAEEKKKQQAEEGKLGSITGELSGLEGQADDIEEEMKELDAGLVEILASVELIQEDITKTQSQIEETKQAYEQAQAEEDTQYESMKTRIRFLYENGDTSYMDIFFGSSDFSEMLNKVEYIEKLYEYDRQLLEEYQAARIATGELKEKLEEEMSQLEATKHELEEEQSILEEMLAKKQAEYDNYEVKIAQAKQQAAIYKENIKRQTEEIRKLEAAQREKDKQIEAAKKEEEERLAALNAQESGSNSSSSSGSGNSSGSDSSSGSSSSSSGSSTGGNYASPGSFGGSKGDQVAQYACQFIGNPYVAGGTSLTNGADCSGFVWRVYKDFGYSISRNSYSLRSDGTGVSYSEAKPGDIVCYAGHVGIYIGNGNIVHASTAKTGIKITHATYKEILSVRRIV